MVQKACMAQSQQKLMLILFFDVQGVAMAEWVLYWKNVDAVSYIETLRKLRICIPCMNIIIIVHFTLRYATGN